MQFQLWAVILKWHFCLHLDFFQNNATSVCTRYFYKMLLKLQCKWLKKWFSCFSLGRVGDTFSAITHSFIDIDVVVLHVKKQYNCHNDDRNQCTWQHKAGDRGDELPLRTISCVCMWTYAHIGVCVCECVCVNGSILRPPILFYFPCESAQSAGLSADPPAWIVFSPDTHTLPRKAKPDCWILAIFHVNGVYRCLFFFFSSTLFDFFAIPSFFPKPPSKWKQDTFAVFACCSMALII